MKKIYAALVGVVLAVAALTGCSVESGERGERFVPALERGGFVNVTVVDEPDELSPAIFYVEAGSCQIWVFGTPVHISNVPKGMIPNRLYAFPPGFNPDNADSSQQPVADPSLAILKKDPRFATCFTDDAAASPSPSPGG